MRRTAGGSDFFSMADRTEFLSSTDLFSGVSHSGLAQIATGMRVLDLRPGETVFRKGETGDAVYLICTGTLRLESDGVHLVTRGAGECVGEFALIDEGPRSASALAETDVCLLRWDRAKFQSALLENPEVARGIFRILTAKLREDIRIQVDYAIEKERWRQDLQRAREIQMGMLPNGDLATERVAVSGYCCPAVEVGGDYYDFFTLGDERLGIIVADVTGHGFYAGLFVAMAKSCLHTLRGIDATPRRIMSAMRHTVALSIQRRLLMSCCYVLLDPQRGKLTYANAGHPYPYLYRAREQRLARLCPLDPILGALDAEGYQFDEGEVDWEKDDLLVMYTDGVTEERNPDGRMFDHDRLEQLIVSHAHASSSELRQTILTALASHSAGAPPRDDLTLVVAKAG